MQFLYTATSDNVHSANINNVLSQAKSFYSLIRSCKKFTDKAGASDLVENNKILIMVVLIRIFKEPIVLLRIKR